MNLSDNRYLVAGGRPKIERHGEPWLSSTVVRFQRFAAYWAARRTRADELRELNRFSDRELWDVGLSRSDIPSIAQGIYRRD